MSVYFGVFRKCYTFVLAMCEMHIGVNSNHLLIRLVCDRWGGFLCKNTLIDQNIFNNIFVLHKIVLPLCRCSG